MCSPLARILALATYAIALSAGAQQTTYGDRATFLAALAPGATTETFDGLNIGTSSGPLASAGGLTFSTPSSLPALFNYSNWWYSLATWPNLQVPSTGQGFAMTVDFGGSVTAFGVDFGRSLGVDPATTFTFTLFNGSTALFSATRTQQSSMPYADFFGVTSSSGFTSATLVASDGPALYDDMTYGAVSPVVTSTPEPATLALLAPLLVVGGCVRRRLAARY